MEMMVASGVGRSFVVISRNIEEWLICLVYPLPGGDAAAKSPWRMAVSYLKSIYGSKADYPETFASDDWANLHIRQIEMLIEKGVNTPLTSSTGRLFDAVASLFGNL